MNEQGRWTISVASLFLAAVLTATALLGNWIGGDGSPRANVQSVTAVVLCAWIVAAALLLAIGWIKASADERENPAAPRERTGPRLHRELTVGAGGAILFGVGVIGDYFGGTLAVQQVLFSLTLWAALLVAVIAAIRLHWRWQLRRRELMRERR